jgi:HAE1 family hydrophobic/amphiphilic exporter-1
MKSFITFFVLRPVFSTMVVSIVLLLGFISFSRLPLDLLPELEFPTISVSTTYRNAGPEEVEELITRPLEQVLAGVPGVEQMVSTSQEGSSSISLNFVWGTDLNAASNDVRDRLDRAVGGLPLEANRPQLRKFDPNQISIVQIGVESRLDPVSLRRLLDQQVQSRLEQVPGVAVVDIRGGLQREIRIEVDPGRLEALGITMEMIRNAVREGNIIQPAGGLREGNREIFLRTPALLTTIEELGNIIVTRRGGAPVYLNQIASIMDTFQDVDRIVRINGSEGVLLMVRKQSGTNTVEVARATIREAARINRDFPEISLVILEDRSVFIQRSLSNVANAILVGGFLACFVLLFFLRNWRTTLVVATAIPISLIATFVLIYFGGMTLNLMTLGGLALGIGMMVDNSIVVIESIYRRRERGQDRRTAAIEGTFEVASAITASTLTTLAIFLPLLFLGGIPGMLFIQLAYVVGFALICSLGSALTLVPMLAANLPGKQVITEPGPISRRIGNFQQRLGAGYVSLLEKALKRRIVVVGTTAFIFFLTLQLFGRLGTEFMPEGDEGQVRINADMDQGVRIDQMDEVMRQIERVVVGEVPEIENYRVDVGSSGWRPSSSASGRMEMVLVSQAERSRSSDEIALALQQRLNGIPGVTIRARAGGGLFIFRRIGGGGEDGERLTLQISGFDLPTMDAIAAQVIDIVQEVPGVTDARATREQGNPRLATRIDRERASDLGFTVGEIARTLQTALGGSIVGQLRDGTGDEVDIRLRLEDARNLPPEAILGLQVQSGGRTAALSNMVSFDVERGASRIQRRNQQRINNVVINVMGRDTGTVAEDIREAIADIALPENINMVLVGDYEEKQEAFRDLVISLVLALLLVYMVMACLYESLRDPLIVMFSVPLAAIGAVLALYFTGSTLNVQSFIGLIMLIGIVVNNAILIVDQANRLRVDDGYTPIEAARLAGEQRFRPILMTMLTTILALSPLALGIGEGGETQASLARVVVGGLITSSVITLFVIPIAYTWFHRGKAGVKASSVSPESECSPSAPR